MNENYINNLLVFLNKLENLKLKTEKLSHNEEYMSDKLAWLLDRKGSHNLGLQFINAFLNETLEIKKYLSLKNSTVIREYSLPTIQNGKNKTKKIDLLFLDLDSRDNVVLAIENKYFTVDHENQLDAYKEFLDKYFNQFIARRPDGQTYGGKVVYLTLNGDKPINCKEEIVKRFSWIASKNSIYSVLKNLDSESLEVKDFLEVLETIQTINCFVKEQETQYESFKNDFLTLIGLNFLEILNNFDKASGYFEFKNSKITHSSYKDKSVFVKISLSLTQNTLQLQVNLSERSFYIPLNIHIDQINHLIYLACFNIYSKLFEKYSTRKDNLSLSQISPILIGKSQEEAEVFRSISKFYHIIRHIEYFQTNKVINEY